MFRETLRSDPRVLCRPCRRGAKRRSAAVEQQFIDLGTVIGDTLKLNFAGAKEAMAVSARMRWRARRGFPARLPACSTSPGGGRRQGGLRQGGRRYGGRWSTHGRQTPRKPRSGSRESGAPADGDDRRGRPRKCPISMTRSATRRRLAADSVKQAFADEVANGAGH